MNKLKEIHDLLPYSVVYGGLVAGLVSITYFFLKTNLILGLLLSLVPFVFYLFLMLLKYPAVAFAGVFIANYFIMGLTRYIPGLPGGVVIDILLLLTLAIAVMRSIDGAISWSRVRNPIVYFSFGWLLYCVFLLANPDGSMARWSVGIRGMAVYFFMFPLLTVVLFNKYKYLKAILILWSALTLLAAFKAFFQKYVGFDSFEKYWLYVIGGARTHIIYSGVRYFSFFTDAASFGCNMALSMVVFAVYSFYVENKWLRIYLLIVALAAGYSMMLSGTRAAIAIPFAGFAVFIILSKQWKIALLGSLLIILTFVFFNYTHIGQGNTEIRRMRSAFSVDRDASFNVRLENQEKMAAFMKDKPFGIGIGNAKQNEEGDYMYQLPTDSSLVYVWIETGIVGLVLFVGLFLITLLKGSIDVLFRIKDKELKGALSALLAGIAGVLVSSYGNEFLQQFPTGPIVYTCMAFVFMGRGFDKERSHEATGS